jgi:DNA-binding MarR family transcriptional regulator
MEIIDLIEFGMTKTEAKIFLELSKFSETKIGYLIKRTGLHRGTVYNSLNDLIAKGFVSFVDREDSRYYKVCREDTFLRQIERKHNEINENKNKVNDFFKKLSSSVDVSDLGQNVEVFQGINAFKNIFLEMYDECSKNKLEYLFFGEGGKMSDTVGIDYYKYTQNLKKKLKINCRVILSKEGKNLPYHKYTVGNIRYLPTKVQSPVNCWIYADKTIFVLWESKPLVTIKINSSSLANAFRNYFEGVWSISETDLRFFDLRHKVNFHDFIEQAQESLDILDICCMEQIHEGRHKILELIRKRRRIRVLVANPKSENFVRRVRLEEQFLKNFNESRILYELKSAVANIKDIMARTQNSPFLEVRVFDKNPIFTIVILDNERALYNKYGKKKGEYGSAKPAEIFEKSNKMKFSQAKNTFESYWKDAKPLNLN